MANPLTADNASMALIQSSDPLTACRTVRTTEQKAHHDAMADEYQDVLIRYAYDIKGQLLEVTDPLDRQVFAHKYDTAGNNLWTLHLDSGAKTLALDAQGKPLFSMDAKGAEVYTAYDTLHRPTDIWAKDASGEDVTLRQNMVYGDSAGLIDPQDENLNGKLYQHYDEAGKLTITGYDFKGNPLEKSRQVDADTELTSTTKYVVDWTGLTIALETTEYVTGLLYDGLNRVRKSIYPEDVDSARKELVPTYNRAGALQAITFDGTDHVRHIAYNAKGQRVMLAMGNDMMTRYAYDEVNFRLLRIKTEKYVEASNTYTPQSGTTRQDSGYAYDLGGNILKITERITDCGISGTTLGADALDRTFAYDPLKRLLQAAGRESDTQSNSNFWEEKPVPGSPNANHTRAYTQTFDYDKVGNILKLGHQASGNAYNRFYRYTSGKNLLEQLDDNGSPATAYASFTYDLNGNQITINTDRFFEWDAADQLRYFKIDAGGGPSVQAHYLYAGGDRVKKLVRDQQGNVEVTVYIDGVYEHRYRKDSGGTITDEQTQLHVMDGRTRIATVRLGDDFGDTTPATVYNLEDHLGTSTTRLSNTGTVVDREEYYPFGESSLHTFDKKRYRYVGKELDSESGLYYYGARYYAAWVGRFVSVDPLADKYPHLNPYNYAGNKPIGDLDIDGMQGTGEAPQATQAANIGNDEFNKRAQAALKSNPTTTELEFTTDGVNSYGSITTGGTTECYDSNVGFTDPAGNVLQKANPQGGLSIPQRDAEGLLVLSKNPSNSSTTHAAGSGSDTIEATMGTQGPETKEQGDRRESLTNLATVIDKAYFGRSAKPAGDDTVEPDQLFYQWVHGTGPANRTFQQGSSMANWMLGADYVQAAMRSAAGKAFKGDLGTTQILHSARETNENWYPVEFAGDAFTNPARAFHGSIAGSVTTYGIVDSNGKKGVVMRIQMSDNMTAISGTRARPSEGGYAKNQPNAVYPQENPYGPNGQFRTIHIKYDINIHYFPN